MTPLQEFYEKWRPGCGHWTCDRAHKKVFCRGTVPCDVLFIGEAPGISENTLGRPFVGPAGDLLQHMINAAIPKDVTYAMTNLVCCMPRDPDTGRKEHEPEVDHIQACATRLSDFAFLCDPKLIVRVGALTKAWLMQGYKNSIPLPKVTTIDIVHPASILRLNVAKKDFMIQQCIVVLSNTVRNMKQDMCEGEEKV